MQLSHFCSSNVPPPFLLADQRLSMMNDRDTVGMKRVASSFYFSAHGGDSVADLMSLLDEVHWQEELDRTARTGSEGERYPSHRIGPALLNQRDVLLHVMSFLDLNSLSNVSEANRLCNSECFAFLNHQLQSVLEETASRAHATALDSKSELASLNPARGLGSLKQLAVIDCHRLERLVHDFRATPSHRPHRYGSTSLRSLLSHLRILLNESKSRLPPLPPFPSPDGTANAYKQAQLGAAAATVVLAFLMSAATLASSGSSSFAATGDSSSLLASLASHVPPLNEHEEILCKMFGVGCLGSLMQAAKAAHERRRDPQPQSRALSEASSGTVVIQGAPVSGSSLPETNIPSSVLSRCLQVAYETAIARWRSHTFPGIPEDAEDQGIAVDESTVLEPKREPLPLVTGWVGAYRHLTYECEQAVRTKILQLRKNRFKALTADEQQRISSAFMESCSHDDLQAVQHIIPQMDVLGFFASADGSTTCGLHTAAFHNACQVLEFLLTDGCCPVNASDANGWTALHFAAGANAVEAVKLLVRHYGADDSLEAANGYTPLQWAVRLQNAGVVQVLRQHQLSKCNSDIVSLMSAQRIPLTAIAARFWSAFGPQTSVRN